ncbi:winged helix-turn-helix domain-containing protein [Actinokineospora diospyrosa]|uniref:Helix-turn-helix domain-containing protein n=1 Tax=Actinokineospora diospyrosa TaxID=103728 RepID=A0ABT1IE85_9PSEU|nr:helix-turn-helix domain-containing protein [Actinokineospora diospyrosa]MCP2270943.1 Helix-turn-helix domain-containing protein [Actinokineospora diospyrosa]
MRDVLYLDQFEQAEVLLKPQRVEVLRQLDAPRSCTEVGARLGQTPQWVYYHVQRLVDAGLVARVSERSVRGIKEGVYQASARSFRLSPKLVGPIGLRAKQDELSLGFVLDLMEEVLTDIAVLEQTSGTGVLPELPSLGVSGQIRVPPERRQDFLTELRDTLQDLFARYGGAQGDAFKLAVACYPQLPKEAP